LYFVGIIILLCSYFRLINLVDGVWGNIEVDRSIYTVRWMMEKEMGVREIR